jgi:hypothetical protein
MGSDPIYSKSSGRRRSVPSLTFHGLLFFGGMNLAAKKQEIVLKCQTRALAVRSARYRALTPILFLLFSLPAMAAPNCFVADPELRESYAGPCKDGLAEGEGEARGAAQYRGGFHAGKKHGQGVKSWPNGDRYEGGFVEDRREGQGKYSWGRGPWAGESYEGPYVNDKRDGEGLYRWPSGDVYRGRFKADDFAGYATPMMLARQKFEEEAKKAVAQEGRKVCREMPIGLAQSEWIRGVVVGVSGEQVGVRVDEPGANRPVIAGVELQKGDVVWDTPTAWTPCF